MNPTTLLFLHHKAHLGDDTARLFLIEGGWYDPHFFSTYLSPKDPAMPTFVDPVLRSALEAIEHHGAANVVLTYAQCRALFHRLRELEATANLGKGEKPDPATDWRRLGSNAVIDAALSTAGPGARVHTAYDDAVDGPMTVDIEGREGVVLTITRQAIPLRHERDALFKVERVGQPGGRLLTAVALPWADVLWLVKEWATPEQTTLDGSADWRTVHMLEELSNACAGPGHALSREDRTVPGTPGVRGGGKLCTVESFIRIVVMDRPQMRFEVRLVGVGGPGGSGAPCDCFSCRCTYDGSTFATELAMTWVGVLGAVRRWSTEAGVLQATLKPKPPERQKDAIDEQLARETIAEAQARAAEEKRVCECRDMARQREVDCVAAVVGGPSVRRLWPHVVAVRQDVGRVEVQLSLGHAGDRQRDHYRAVFAWQDFPSERVNMRITRHLVTDTSGVPPGGAARMSTDDDATPHHAVQRFLACVVAWAPTVAQP